MSVLVRVKALALLSSGFRFSFAQVVPTTPGPNEIYTANSNCTIAWEPDSTGTWKNMTIGKSRPRPPLLISLANAQSP